MNIARIKGFYESDTSLIAEINQLDRGQCERELGIFLADLLFSLDMGPDVLGSYLRMTFSERRVRLVTLLSALAQVMDPTLKSTECYVPDELIDHPFYTDHTTVTNVVHCIANLNSLKVDTPFELKDVLIDSLIRTIAVHPCLTHGERLAALINAAQLENTHGPVEVNVMAYHPAAIIGTLKPRPHVTTTTARNELSRMLIGLGRETHRLQNLSTYIGFKVIEQK